MIEKEHAECAEDWADMYITRDLEGLNKISTRLVTRLWEDEENSHDHAWVITFEATPDGELNITKRRIDPHPWKQGESDES